MPQLIEWPIEHRLSSARTSDGSALQTSTQEHQEAAVTKSIQLQRRIQACLQRLCHTADSVLSVESHSNDESRQLSVR